MTMQLTRPDSWFVANNTQAHYEPNFKAVERRLAKGQHEMKKALSREFLP